MLFGGPARGLPRYASTAAWGEPADDAALTSTARSASASCARASSLVALQPDRGRRDARKGDYHDPNLPPRHAYVAFYLWLRARARRIDALDPLRHAWHAGMAARQGRRAVAKPARRRPCSAPCLSSIPSSSTIPARRRRPSAGIAAVTIGHLTPPLVRPAQHGAAAELEALFDEYADRRGARSAPRARILAQAILDRARGDRPRRRTRRLRCRRSRSAALRQARRLALRPQGDAHRRRPARVRPRRPAPPRRRARRRDASVRDGAERCAAPATPAPPPRRAGAARRAGRPLRPARPRRRAAARPRSTCCRPGATSTPSIRAPSRPAPPGRSASAPPRRSSRATRRTMATGRSASCSTSGAAPPCAPAATISRRRWRCSACRPIWDQRVDPRVAASRSCRCAILGRPRVDVTLAHFRPVPRRVPDARSRCSTRRCAPSPRSTRTPTTIRSRLPAARGRRGRAHLRRRARQLRRRHRRAPCRGRLDGRGTSWREAYLAATGYAYGGEGEGVDAAAAFRSRVASARRLRPCAGHGRAGRARCRRLRRA